MLRPPPPQGAFLPLLLVCVAAILAVVRGSLSDGGAASQVWSRPGRNFPPPIIQRRRWFIRSAEKRSLLSRGRQSRDGLEGHNNGSSETEGYGEMSCSDCIFANDDYGSLFVV